MAEEACCTCATLLSAIPPQYDEKTEKPIAHDRRLECCGRVICGRCIAQNSRFATYCPFCQVSTAPSSLPQGLRDPPAYSPPPPLQPANAALTSVNEDEPPSYSSIDSRPQGSAKSVPSSAEQGQPAEDVLHFLDPAQDTISSLSLRYRVPQDALKRTNGLYADHLLAARRTVLIPGEFYKGGVSLSPRPIECEDEEIRKVKVRRWMVACKVAEYDVALLYLKQAEYDLDAAVDAFKADEKWERENPMSAASKGKSKQSTGRRKYGVGGGITGQVS
ncbi:LysM domain [Lasallia pustulata]|uniref:LysM domain n=1 Tax=Lasallia pustulata TaxID=136370 RepID=A0A1W5CST6_9LECA|nr:LysM domain [Lasallia pustulata]